MQDMKKYNREMIARQRKDQIELQKISQYHQVRSLYKVAQEKALVKSRKEKKAEEQQPSR